MPNDLQLPFREVTALIRVGEGRFTGDVHPSWTIGGKPNGGYLLAMTAAAATAEIPHPHPIAANAHYVRSPEPGPVEIVAEVLRAGRSASQARARLLQDGHPCIEAVITASTLDPAAVPYWDEGAPTAGDVPFEACVPLPGRTPDGSVTVALMDQVDLRLEPASAGFTAGAPTGHGELRGWLALPGDGAFDPLSLLFAVDAFPPATFDVEFTGWVPTLELTVYVRALPAPGPVRVLQRAQLIDGQRVDEACFVWDRTGRLVAQGTQLAGIRLG